MTDEFINSIKVGLLGPLAGIGAAVTQATLPPIILSIAIGLSSGGSAMGAVFAVIALYAANIILSRLFYMQGYKSGREAVHVLLGKQMSRIQDAMSVLGLTVVGAITASYVNFTITAQYVLSLIHIYNVFIGCNTNLVAPVTVRRNAYIACLLYTSRCV